MTGLKELWATFLRDEQGGPTIEFVVIFPAIVFFIFAYGEAGTLATRAVMLERGLDIAIRDIRTTGFPPGTDPDRAHEFIKHKICTNAFLIAGSCLDDLLLEMKAVGPGEAFPNTEAVICEDVPPGAVAPVTFGGNTNAAANSEIMLVRACLPVNPLFGFSIFGGGQVYNVRTSVNGDFEQINVAAGDGRVDSLGNRLGRTSSTNPGQYTIQAQSAFLNEPPD